MYSVSPLSIYDYIHLCTTHRPHHCNFVCDICLQSVGDFCMLIEMINIILVIQVTDGSTGLMRITNNCLCNEKVNTAICQCWWILIQLLCYISCDFYGRNSSPPQFATTNTRVLYYCTLINSSLFYPRFIVLAMLINMTIVIWF